MKYLSNFIKVKFNKSYDATEDAMRFEIFKNNLRNNTELNEKYKKGKVTWEVEANQFSDWTPEEHKNIQGGFTQK